MSEEQHTISNTLLFLGLVMFVITFMSLGSNTSWTGLQTTLSNGPALPQNPSFGDPYTLSEHSVTITPVANGWYGPMSTWNSGGVSHCVGAFPWTSGDYWGCASTSDNGVSFVTVSPACCSNPYTVSFNMSTFTLDTGTGTHTDLLAIDVTFACKTEGGFTDNWYFGFTDPATPNIQFASTQYSKDTCNLNGWQTLHAIGNYRIGLNVTPFDISKFSGSHMVAQINNTVVTDLSYVSATITYMVENFNKDVTYTSYDIGCVLNQGITWLNDFFSFLVGSAIFIVRYVAALLGFFFSIVAGLVVGLVGSLVWLMAMPGMPPFLQAGLDILLLAVIGNFFYVVIRLLRGGG